ncbi:hypothetical protein NW762_008805 [Fusarium torreyae]|uniref:Uncharacterized protein n=1 Tax=Fusarium torreyae TaxID=1237075 RepID=A0A9W8VBP3_9HYPO|nr:hypothetical protein NW762_008805 [Fusarium torreyae]
MLSLRAIHWSRHTFTWHCHSSMTNFTHGRPSEEPKEIDPVYRLGLTVAHPKLSINNLWTYVLGSYAKMVVTYEADRLVAVQGLVDRLVGLYGDEYFAGVFRSHLASGLVWDNSYYNAEKALDGVPTWSWASNCPGVWFQNPSHSLINYDEETVFPKDRGPLNLDTPEKRALRFEAPLINVQLEKTFTSEDIVPYCPDWRPLKSDSFLDLGIKTEPRVLMHFSYDAANLVPDSFSEVTVLFVAINMQDGNDIHKVEEPNESIVVDQRTFISYHGIIVQPMGQFYERVGLVDFDVPRDYQSWLEIKQWME